MKIGVIGGGSWGTALSILLSRNGHDVHMHVRDQHEVDSLTSHRENVQYLQGFAIPESVSFHKLAAPVAGVDCVLIAVPSAAVRSIVEYLPGGNALILSAAKGLEASTGARVCEIVALERPEARVGALSGPNLAVEIVRGVPTASVAAFEAPEDAEIVQELFRSANFRVYVSQDVIGVEFAGALKNVLAIGAGMSDALGFGDNTKGALLARGLHEMTSLGLALGARIETFMGVAGVGDLFATAVSTLSRNYRVGKMIGQGVPLQDALDSIGQVAEGVTTSDSALVLARRTATQVPVFETINLVLRGKEAPLPAVAKLMERAPRAEGFLPLSSTPLGGGA